MIDAHLLPIIPIPVAHSSNTTSLHLSNALLLLLPLNCNLDVVTTFSSITPHGPPRNDNSPLLLLTNSRSGTNQTRPGVGELSHTPDRLLIIMTEPSEKTINPNK